MGLLFGDPRINMKPFITNKKIITHEKGLISISYRRIRSLQ